MTTNHVSRDYTNRLIEICQMIFESFINNVAFLVFEILRAGGVHSQKMPRRIGLNLILYLQISNNSMITNVIYVIEIKYL